MIQFRCEGFFENKNEMQERHELEKAIGLALKQAEIGFCGAGQSGVGSIELLCYVRDLTKGSTILKEVLTQRGLLEGAVIAYADCADCVWRVVHPANYPKPFSLLGYQ